MLLSFIIMEKDLKSGEPYYVRLNNASEWILSEFSLLVRQFPSQVMLSSFPYQPVVNTSKY